MATNPVRRIREQRGMSLDSFAKEVGVHLQAVYLNERGVYHSILPTIRAWFEREGYNVKELDEEYAFYQYEVRQDTGNKLKAGDVVLPEPNGKNPLVEFRLSLGLSRAMFCKVLAIHPAFAYKVERGQAHGLSFQAKTALHEAGFSTQLIEELDFRCAEYADANSSLERTAG